MFQRIDVLFALCSCLYKLRRPEPCSYINIGRVPLQSPHLVLPIQSPGVWIPLEMCPAQVLHVHESGRDVARDYVALIDT